jgi:hypothetical protein
MSETPISPLRARMIEDMSVRKFGEATKELSQRSLAARRPSRLLKIYAAIRCIKAAPVSNRAASTALGRGSAVLL